MAVESSTGSRLSGAAVARDGSALFSEVSYSLKGPGNHPPFPLLSPLSPSSTMSVPGPANIRDLQSATAARSTIGVKANKVVGEMAKRRSSRPPVLQIIVLGAGGGPQETNTTAFLVRSLSSGWRKGSVVAVDAGVHLSAIERILERSQPQALGTDVVPLPHVLESGPFAGLELTQRTPSANASLIMRNLIDTYLITHPHLDHIAGFVVNTAGIPGTRPKRLAGLPPTINALKTHIFNNVIWPNLSDENNGAGLLSYLRLVEGGSAMMGEDGYLEMTDGLAVKTWSVSHGHCVERHSHRGSVVSRLDSFDGSMMGMHSTTMPTSMSMSHGSLRIPSMVRTASSGPLLQSFDLGGGGGGSMGSGGAPTSVCSGGLGNVCVYDSSVYFIRDVNTHREVLIFGDVEPDSISLSPRNLHVWQQAAPKTAAGTLAAILIEVSYDDSRPDHLLFGHMTPRYLIEELRVLADKVAECRSGRDTSMAPIGGLAGSNGRILHPSWASELKRRDTTVLAPYHPPVPPRSVLKRSASYAIVGHKRRKRDPLYAYHHNHADIDIDEDDFPAPGGSITTAPAAVSVVGSTGKRLLHSRTTISHIPYTTPTVTSATAGGGPSQRHQSPVSPKSGRISSNAKAAGLRTASAGSGAGSPLHIVENSDDGSDGTLSPLGPPSRSLGNYTSNGILDADNALRMQQIRCKQECGHEHDGCNGHDSGVAHGHEDAENANHDDRSHNEAAPLPKEGILKGLKVVIIHVKDKQDDGRPAGEIIMEQLQAHADEELGCEFVLSSPGLSILL